jgi:hypothetical protein
MRLSAQLQVIGMRHYAELPVGAARLLMKVGDGSVHIEVYDSRGKLIGTVPSEKTSKAFRADLHAAFRTCVSPDPEGVVATLSAPGATAR